ncbi:MAG: hypothetical protein ACYDGS_04010 [Thermoleophilia bacterium]
MSVEYTIANNGSGEAFDFQLLSFGATNQVEPLTVDTFTNIPDRYWF